MLLQIRSLAVSAAVVFFFVISLVGSLGGVAPFTCCKRGLLGALVAYVTAAAAARMVNAILMQAMVMSHVDKDKAGDHKN